MVLYRGKVVLIKKVTSFLGYVQCGLFVRAFYFTTSYLLTICVLMCNKTHCRYQIVRKKEHNILVHTIIHNELGTFKILL